MWDIDKWRGVFTRDDQAAAIHIEPLAADGAGPIDMRMWTRCGIAMLVLYLGSAVIRGGVYRPRGLDLDNPYFYVMPAVMLLPIATFVIEQRRRNRLQERHKCDRAHVDD